MHLPHGRGRQQLGRGLRPAARAWIAKLARHRCLDHAADDLRQSQCIDHDDRRQGVGPDPWPQSRDLAGQSIAKETFMLYEFATLSFHPLNAGKATAGAEAYVTATEARGRLLGCWTTEIGTLGRLFVLRGFADAAELAAERKRALFSTNPFGAAEVLTGLEMDSYAPFPFLPPVEPGTTAR